MSKPSLQELLGLRWPVIQAPMAGSQGSALALDQLATQGDKLPL